ncbi:MAG: carboxypeptidase regulatory-like domain-containing protein [Candidatus Binataceae bacterium]|nr:carboxypeptidase regulatory-like domain-containing protein [Candidatus Binataceae bacterium]
MGLVQGPATSLASSAAYQNILLNVVSIRLNRAKNATGANGNWVVIPAPTGVGRPVPGLISTAFSAGGSFFNIISNPYTNPGRSEIQIDLNNLQNTVQLFNTAQIPAQIYNTVELVIDPAIPGNIIPNCPNIFPAPIEGCITYPLKFGPNPVALTTTSMVNVAPHTLTNLVVEFTPNTITPPSGNGGPYSFSPQISVVANGSNGANPLMALVSGKVTGIPAGAHETVTAETSGTGNLIASAKVTSDGSYTMQLPVDPNGTSYDFFAAGDGASYDIQQPAPLIRGNITTLPDFTVTSQKTGSVSGVVSGTIGNHCNPAPIVAATIEILTSSNNSDCTTVPTPASCVVVASTATDGTGSYPSPGRTGVPQPFNFLPAATAGTYALRVSASGYDTVTTPVDNSAGPVTCPSEPNGKCSFDLTTALIAGTVSISPPPPGTSAQIQVFAENTGTNDIVGALPFPLQITSCTNSASCTASFQLNVPQSPGTYDVFAASSDLYNGVPDQFSGHVFSTMPSVAANPACPASSGGITIPTLSCAGHGSMSSSVAPTFDLGTTVRLLKNGVQVEQSPVGPVGTSNAGAFSFCAPADSYTIQRWEGNAAASGQVPVTLPAPAPTASPCAICSNAGVCPGNCENQSLASPF